MKKDLIIEMFNQGFPFHKTLGLELDFYNKSIRFNMKNELIGNSQMGILHGGVIASALDVAGGLTVAMGLAEKFSKISSEEFILRFSKMGTIDMRVDYLNPGKGRRFYTKTKLLRQGNKISVTSSELFNDEDTLIAISTATYLVG